MENTILVAGATGNLGEKIIDALLAKGAIVKAIVRLETDPLKVNTLEKKGVHVFKINMADKKEVVNVCLGVDCVVSALAGLKETIIDSQKILLDAAVAANVPRFIPSGFASDYTNLIVGQNRNLDLRREFDSYADTVPIKLTTVFNGAFMDLLVTDMPLILIKKKRILCWGDPNQIIEFTTTHNIAEFTAKVALDTNTPRYMRIAGDRLTCNGFVKVLTELTGKDYKLFRPGGIGLLNMIIKITRFFSPSPKELYPAWQGMQYMRDMMEGRVIFTAYDNNRYTGMRWTTVKDFLIDEHIELK